ncbi:MAG: hypothetical protein ACYCQI_05030 [Gammaproteobacteria bacterium]
MMAPRKLIDIVNHSECKPNDIDSSTAYKYIFEEVELHELPVNQIPTPNYAVIIQNLEGDITRLMDADPKETKSLEQDIQRLVKLQETLESERKIPTIFIMPKH